MVCGCGQGGEKRGCLLGFLLPVHSPPHPHTPTLFIQVLGGHDVDVVALEKEFGSMDMEGSGASHDRDRKVLLDEVREVEV